jgi:hypothetical protein
VPIIAVILILGTPKARSNGPAFAAGWVLGLVAVSTVVVLVASGSDDPDSGTSTAVGIVEVAIGALFLLSGVNPKNPGPHAGRRRHIAQAGLDGGGTVVAIAVFVIIGSLTVAGPVVFYAAGSSRAAGPLESIKEFMADHNAVIMMVVLLVLGAKVLGQGIAGLTD